MHNGLTTAQLTNLVSIIQSKAGVKEGNAANAVLQIVLKPGQNRMEISMHQTTDTLFPKGEKIINNNFKITAWLKELVKNDRISNTLVGNVTFEPADACIIFIL